MSQPRIVAPYLEPWPALPLADWLATKDTLHMWTQIVGKIRMALTPPVNHFWHVTLYVTAAGLTTSPIPYGDSAFEIEFDFLEQRLIIRTAGGLRRSLPLAPRSVADFYRDLMAALSSLGIQVRIHKLPQEVPSPIPFDQDTTHASYDDEAAARFWRILLSSDRVFKQFRGRFLGKCSPVHFFWGSFDMAVSRFSGRAAPERPGADLITREAYSHEVISAGFWPGNGGYGEAAFYCYAAPSPAKLAEAKVEPAAAYFDTKLGEFLLKYNDVRTVSSPDKVVRAFLDSTYAAAANMAGWDRAALERH